MLSNGEIIDELDSGKVIIEPFNVRNLGPNSYDVRLGEFYFREQTPKIASESYNIYDEEEVRAVWGYTHKARLLGVDGVINLKRDDRVIVLQPGEMILAHTEEFIGGRIDISTMMKARSSLGRNFIRVCACAGMGDVGYFNRWTMEIENISRFRCIPLRVGMRLAQIVFFRTGKQAADYAAGGKYQASSQLEIVMKNWKPDDMLPRLYNDWELRRQSRVLLG